MSAALTVVRTPESRDELRNRLVQSILDCKDRSLLETVLAPLLRAESAGPSLASVRADVVAAFQARFAALGTRRLSAAEKKELFPETQKRRVKVGIPVTHYDVAQRVSDEVKGDLLHEVVRGEWLQWTGCRWEKLYSSQVLPIIRRVTNAIELGATAVDVDLAPLKFSGFAAGVARELSGLPEVHVNQERFNLRKEMMAVRNGAVDVKTGKLVCDRSLLVTVLNETHFDPEAECPRFLRALHDSFEGRSEDIRYYELIMGYTLQADPAERAMFFHIGKGSNGKTMLLKAVYKALGGNAAIMNFTALATERGAMPDGKSEGPSVSMLKLNGKRMAYVDEFPKNGVLRDAAVKALAGGGPLAARGMHHDTDTEFDVTAAVHIACNSIPTVRGGEGATWSRTYPVVYTRQFEEEGPNSGLPLILDREREGILAWLVRCSMKYVSIKAAGKRIRDYMPARARLELENIRETQDPLADWIADCCEYIQDGTMTLLQAWESFADYKSKRGAMPKNIASDRAMKTWLVDNYSSKARYSENVIIDGRRCRAFRGIRVRGPSDVTEAPQCV